MIRYLKKVKSYFFIMSKSHEKCPLWSVTFLYHILDGFHNPLKHNKNSYKHKSLIHLV